MTIKYLSRKQASKLNQKLTIIDKNHQRLDKNHQSNQSKTSDLLVSFDITCWACWSSGLCFLNKLWCMPFVWRNCYQCIAFALLCFHSLSSWYPDLWFYFSESLEEFLSFSSQVIYAFFSLRFLLSDFSILLSKTR